MAQVTTIRLWRGRRANLPLAAPDGIPMWCSDTHQLFMGTDDGRVLLAGPSDDQASAVSTVYTLGGEPVVALDGSALGVLAGPAIQADAPASSLVTLADKAAVTLDGATLAALRKPEQSSVPGLVTLAGTRVTTLSGQNLARL